MNRREYILSGLRMARRDTLRAIDFKAKLLIWITLDLAIGSAMYWALGMRTEAWQKGVEFLAYTFLPAAVVLSAVFLWMLLFMPHKTRSRLDRIHDKKVSRLGRQIELLTACADSPLRFFFDRTSKQHNTEFQNMGPYRRIGLMNSGPSPARRIRARFKEIVAIRPRDDKIDSHVSVLVHAPLVVKHGTPNDGRLELNPGEQIDFDIASLWRFSDGPKIVSGIRIHRVDQFGSGPAGPDQFLRFPIGCYRITVEAFSDDHSSSEFEFFVGMSGKGLALAPVRPSARSLTHPPSPSRTTLTRSTDAS